MQKGNRNADLPCTMPVENLAMKKKKRIHEANGLPTEQRKCYITNLQSDWK